MIDGLTLDGWRVDVARRANASGQLGIRGAGATGAIVGKCVTHVVLSRAVWPPIACSVLYGARMAAVAVRRFKAEGAEVAELSA
jgi:hypothetical protein